MANARKLPSGSWRIRVYDSSTGKYRSFTCDDPTQKGKRIAEKMASDFLLGLKIEATDDTLRSKIRDYIAIRNKRLSPTTIEKYEKVYQQLSESFLDTSLDKLSDKDIMREINALSAKYAPKTIRNAMMFVIPIIRDERPDLAKHIDLPKIQKKLKDYPRAEEIMRIFKGDQYELEILLALCCSLRKEEIRGLRPSDLQNGILTIHRVKVDTKQGVVVKDEAKTVESRRRIALPPFIESLYNSRQGEWILQTSGNSLYRHFKRVMKANGYEGICFHDLRHINASEMLSLNVPNKYAMERGGWATDNILKSVYQSTFSDERIKYDRIIDNHFSEIYDTKYDTKCNAKVSKLAIIRYFKRLR